MLVSLCAKTIKPLLFPQQRRQSYNLRYTFALTHQPLHVKEGRLPQWTRRLIEAIEAIEASEAIEAIEGFEAALGVPTKYLPAITNKLRHFVLWYVVPIFPRIYAAIIYAAIIYAALPQKSYLSTDNIIRPCVWDLQWVLQKKLLLVGCGWRFSVFSVIAERWT